MSGSGSSSSSPEQPRARQGRPALASLEQGAAFVEEFSWSGGDDPASVTHSSEDEDGEYALYRRRFPYDSQETGTKAEEGASVPRGWEEDMFRTHARLGYVARNVAPEETREGRWKEWCNLQIEAKSMPCKRMAVEVLTVTMLHTPEQMASATDKYEQLDPDRPMQMVDFHNKVTIRKTHESVKLTKGASLIMPKTESLAGLSCSYVVLRFFDTGGLRLLKPTRVGGDVLINVDVLALKTLQELKYCEEYAHDKPFPVVEGSFDIEVGKCLFFFHFRFSGVMLMQIFDRVFAPLLTEENLHLSAVHKLVFERYGVFARGKAAAATSAADKVEVESGMSLSRLPVDLKMLVLAALDYPDLLRVICCSRSFHQLFLARRFTIIARNWAAKMGRFVGCLVDLNEVYSVWNGDTSEQAQVEAPSFPVLRGAAKLDVIYRSYFMPTAMRFKVAGGKKVLRMPVQVTISSAWRGCAPPVSVSLVATDGQWFSLPETASCTSCLFTLELPKDFGHDVTDVQMKGMSVEMLWAAPWWLFLMMDAKANVRYIWWRECLLDLRGCRSPCVSISGEDFAVLGSVLTDVTIAKEWKKLAVQGMFLASCSTPIGEVAAVGRWLTAMVESPVVFSTCLEQVFCLALRKASHSPDETLHEAVFSALLKHPELAHQFPRNVSKLCNFVDAHSLVAPLFLEYVATGLVSKPTQVTQALDLLFRMVLDGDMLVVPHIFLGVVARDVTGAALRAVAQKFCGRFEDVIRPWLEKNSSDQTDKSTWQDVLRVMGDGIPAGKIDIRRAVLHNVCTLKVTGKDYKRQLYFLCTTCWPEGGKGCCVACAVNCHLHHALSEGRSAEFYCDCGSPEEASVIRCSCVNKELPQPGWRQLAGF